MKKTARQTLKQLLSEDEPRTVVDKLLELTSEKDADIYNQLIVVSSRLKELERAQIKGTAIFMEFNSEKARINDALLSIIDNLPTELANVETDVKTVEAKPVALIFSTVPVLSKEILPKTAFVASKSMVLGGFLLVLGAGVAVFQFSKNKNEPLKTGETTVVSQNQTPQTNGQMSANSGSTNQTPTNVTPVFQPKTNQQTASNNAPLTNQMPVQNSPQPISTPFPKESGFRSSTVSTPVLTENAPNLATEEADWKATETANTAEAYKQFLAKFPKSNHATMATEMIDWKGVVKVNTLDGYTDFLKRFPNGACQQKALDRIAQLKAKAPFNDSRDGKTYRPALIANKIWLSENVKYPVNGVQMYDDKAANLDKLGGLYKLEQAKTVCPQGWHLPTDEEFQQLLNAFGGGTKAWAALSKGGASGFEVLGSGFVEKGENMFLGINEDAVFWTASQQSGAPILYYFDGGKKEIYRVTTSQLPVKAASCRCVKN